MDKFIVTIDNFTQKIDSEFKVSSFEKAQELAEDAFEKFKGDKLVIRIYDYKDYRKGLDWIVDYKTPEAQPK